jgi:DMSO reductase anchor subunit
MIYVDTQRPFWTRRITHPKFALTTLILGSGSVLVAATSGGRADWMVISAGCLLSFTTFKLGWEILFAFRHAANRQSPWQATARLHTEVFPGLFLARLLCGALGGGLVPGLVLGGAVADAEWLLALGLVLSTTGELLERHLFFVCESAPRMPGGITA